MLKSKQCSTAEAAPDEDLERVPQRLEDDEVIELVPTPLAEALEMVWRGDLIDAKSAIALVHAARNRGCLA